MALYEHVFLARQDISGQQVDELTDHFKKVITDMGGSVGKVEYWGVKTLSHLMNKNRKAHYTLMNVDAPSDAMKEVERQMRLHEDVIRYLTLRVDELEEEPSVMTRKQDTKPVKRSFNN
jgi:small subunit ribosomal protein S6